jgi:type II secretory pathway component GspD/PulD (secretin)
MSRRLFLCSLLVMTTVSASAKDDSPANAKRGAYVAKHASAKDLAGILAKQFKGVAEIQASPEGTSNCLLINASPAVFEEILKTLEQLDRTARTIAVEVFVVEMPVRKADEKGKGLEEKDLNGSLDQVAVRLDGLMKKGQVTGFKRIRLTTLERQSGSLTMGETKPHTTGVRVTPAGLTSRTIAYRNVGTEVKVTPTVASDGSITLDLNVQDSRTRDSSTATVGTDGDGKAVPATEFIVTTLNSKLGFPSGSAVLAKDAKVTSKEGEGETFIVVGARAIEPENKEK